MARDAGGNRSGPAARALLSLVLGTALLVWPAWPVGALAALQRSLLLPFDGATDVRIEEVVVTRDMRGEPKDLRMTATLSIPGRTAPAAIVVGEISVGATLQSVMIFGAVLLLVPVAAAREWPLRLAISLPCLAIVEFATTSLQLLAPVAAARSRLDTGVEHSWMVAWSRWIESGGRIALAVTAALCVVAAAASLSRCR